MLRRLTVDLLVRPEQAWPLLARRELDGLAVPSPRQHLAAAALVSVVATGVGCWLKPGTTAGGAVLQMLAACVGYLGGPALAVELYPRLSGLRPSVETRTSMSGSSYAEPRASTISSASYVADDGQKARFAAAAQLPIALSGALNVIPLLPMSFALAFAGAALSVHSGWIGASAMLALEGQARIRAAAAPAGLAVGVVLLATCLRMVLPP